MKKLFICAVLVVVLVTLASCAASPNEMVKTPDAQGEVAGFWQGLWQGFISPFAFLLSLFKDNIGIYEVHNNGGWYNFGFLMGASIIFGGSGGGAARRRR